ELLLGREHVAVVELALVADEAAEDVDALLEELDAGQLLRGPGLPEQLERAVLGERPDALGVYVLADQPFEDGVDRRAELERIAGLGLALLDVVQLEAQRAL